MTDTTHTATALPSPADLRAEVAAWLSENWAGLPEEANWERATPERVAWLDKVLEAGYAVPTLPADWFGRAYRNELAAVIEAEFNAAGAPGGCQDKYNIGANTALKYGTERLKTDIIRGLLTGRITTCLFYSEPGAGSDLAGVRTTAVRDGD